MYNVILPTYNESKNIIPIINIIKNIFNKIKTNFIIIVIDDNSPDGTGNLVENLNDYKIKLIKRSKKSGLGSAYIDGSSHCIFPYTIVLDTDLQHNPYDILEMHKLIIHRDPDIVTGTRYKNGFIYKSSFIRNFISCTANNIARYVLGIKTSDVTGSFRIYKTEIYKKLINKIKCKGFGFQMEIIARAEIEKMKIIESPICFFNREYGKSKFSIKEIILFIYSVLYLYISI